MKNKTGISVIGLTAALTITLFNAVHDARPDEGRRRSAVVLARRGWRVSETWHGHPEQEIQEAPQ